MRSRVASLFVIVMMMSLTLKAQIPQQITYQGFLESGGQPVSATVPITVRLYTQSSGGAASWSQSFPSVAVSGGVYTLLLDVTGLDFTIPYWLETEINGSISPTRTALASVPYSLGPWTLGAVGPSIVQKGELRSTKGVLSSQDIYFTTGNVGIGTTTPQNLLQVGAGTTTILASRVNEVVASKTTDAGIAIAQNSGVNVLLQASAGGGYLGTTSNNDFVIRTNDLDRMIVTANGSVGIGTTTPSSQLEIDAQDGLKILGYQPFLTLSDANAGSARTVLQNANGDLCLFTTNDLGSGLPVLKLKSSSGSRAELLAQDGLNTIGYQPFLTLTDANAGYARARVQCANGDMNLFAESALSGGNAYVVLKNVSGNVGIGTPTPGARLEVAGHTRTQVLEITGGSDLAEPFETAGGRRSDPGTVMVIDAGHPGKLIPSGRAYDKRVAGIVSGAGGIHAGVTMRQHGILEGSSLIAIAGRVYCKAEARSAPIEPGDLLTTSDLEGTAMKAGDESRSHGAIIGKAMTGLKEGTGLVLVLVNLQ